MHGMVWGGELHNNLFLILSQLSSTLSYHHDLEINCVRASNWFIHLQRTRQIDGQDDNSVLIVHVELSCMYQISSNPPPSARRFDSRVSAHILKQSPMLPHYSQYRGT